MVQYRLTVGRIPVSALQHPCRGATNVKLHVLCSLDVPFCARTKTLVERRVVVIDTESPPEDFCSKCLKHALQAAQPGVLQLTDEVLDDQLATMYRVPSDEELRNAKPRIPIPGRRGPRRRRRHGARQVDR